MTMYDVCTVMGSKLTTLCGLLPLSHNMENNYWKLTVSSCCIFRHKPNEDIQLQI